MHVQFYSDFEALPPGYGNLFHEGAAQSFCLTRWWFENLARGTLDESERLCLIGVESDELELGAMALVIGRHRDRDADVGGARSLSGLGNYYSMIFAPLVARSVDQAKVLTILFEAVRGLEPRYDVLRFQALDRESPIYHALQMVLHEAGFAVRPFFHFGNLYESTKDISSQAYFERRRSTLRNIIRRKGGKLERAGRARFELITGGPELERGMADYEQIYAASWKEPEPYPQFIRGLVRFCAASGALRLGLIYLDGEPAAAQIWIVWRGIATIYKLVHDQRFNQLSVGTILTARLMERVIDVDNVVEVDFGSGDDPFKKDWMSNRRERWGMIAFNLRTVRGAKEAMRHLIGRGIKKAIS